MALTHSNAYVAMAYAPFVAQIEVAILTYAGVVLVEVNTTTDHTNRINLAYAVVKNPSHYAQLFAQYLVAQNLGALSMDAGGTTITVADAAIDATISAGGGLVWSQIADALASPVS